MHVTALIVAGGLAALIARASGRGGRMVLPPRTPLRLMAVALVLLTVAAGCASIGHDFPADRVSEIRIGSTTRSDILATFGNPWRTGVEDGEVKWTYGRYRWGLFGGGRAQDLSVRFDGAGVVTSYSFNTTESEAPGGGPE